MRFGDVSIPENKNENGTMIQITPQMRIYLCTEPIDFRKGIDGLARFCRAVLDQDPFSGSMFVFRNKRRTTVKILVYDGQGFWLFIKRLSSGRFKWWPLSTSSGSLSISPKSPGSVRLKAGELQLLLWNGDVGKATIEENWRELKPPA